MPEEQTLSLFKVEDLKPEYREVKLADIDLPGDYNSESYMLDGINSIGVVHDIILARVRGEAKYTIIDGKRRVFASRQAGKKKTICAKIFQTNDKFQIATLTLLSNFDRDNNPVSELEALSKIENHPNAKQLLKMLNVSKAAQTSLRKLLILKANAPGLYKAMKLNDITYDKAKKIAELKSKDQVKLEKKYKSEGTITDADITEIKNKYKEKAGSIAQEVLSIADTRTKSLQDLVSDIEKDAMNKKYDEKKFTELRKALGIK